MKDCPASQKITLLVGSLKDIPDDDYLPLLIDSVLCDENHPCHARYLEIFEGTGRIEEAMIWKDAPAAGPGGEA